MLKELCQLVLYNKQYLPILHTSHKIKLMVQLKMNNFHQSIDVHTHLCKFYSHKIFLHKMPLKYFTAEYKISIG